jgi:hypothetical protein
MSSPFLKEAAASPRGTRHWLFVAWGAVLAVVAARHIPVAYASHSHTGSNQLHIATIHGNNGTSTSPGDQDEQYCAMTHTSTVSSAWLADNVQDTLINYPVRQVPARATIYLPVASAEFGDDVSFWRRPADPGFTAVLDEFVQLDAGVQAWHQPAFGATLQDYRRRFEQTGTEEGMVMATVLAYMADDLRTSRRAAILDEFRTSRRILGLFEQGMRELGVRAAP